MPAIPSFPQLSFAMNNPGADNTIYITTDPEVNQLTLLITTNTVNTVLTPGTPVPPADAPDAPGSLLYFDLSSLQIPAADFEKIVFDAIGWTYKSFPNSIICITPEEEMTIDELDPISIEIKELVIPDPPSSASVNLTATYYHIDPITEGNIGLVSFFKELLQDAPGGHKNFHNVVDCVLTTGNSIVNTIEDHDPVSNNISFAFQPGESPKTVKAGPDTTFTLSFVYASSAPGYGALTTPQSAVNDMIVEQGQNAAAWSITPDPDADNPSWILQPPSGIPIIGSGAGAIVSFDITNIDTNFEAGPTLMYVQYSHIPGYNDGGYFIILNKVQHVSIGSLTAKPNPAVINDGEAMVNISWKTKAAQSLMLMPFYKTVTGKTNFDAKLKKSTVVKLVATGYGSDANRAEMEITVDILPVINSFHVTPSNVYYNDYPHDAKFYWDVATNEEVLLVDDANNSSQVVQPSGTITQKLSQPGMWSLIPQDPVNPFTLARNVLIQSFKTSSESYTPGFVPAATAASPSAEFIAVVNTAADSVSILNALNFSPYTDPISTDPTPVDLVFSNSGNYLFVLNGSGSLTPVRITYDNDKSIYTFTALPSLPVEGRPKRIAVSSDDKYIFITTSVDQLGKLFIIENNSNDGFPTKQNIRLEASAAGIALDPSGLNVYVALTSLNSIAVVGYSSVNDAFTYNRSISNVPANPVDVAVAGPDGKTLLIVCTASNQLMVVDSDDDGTSPRQPLSLNKGPVRITTTADRAYAFVTNTQSDDVTLINCYGGTGNCKILEQSIAAGSKPGAIAVAYDSTAAYISNGSNNVTVFNLVNYQLRQTPIAIGKQPTSVIASADGEKIVMWHDVLFVMNDPGFDKGIYIYETGSGTVTHKLDEMAVIRCLFSSSSPADTMYLLQKDTNTISVLETGKFSIKSTIPIPDSGTGKRSPVDIGMSADAANLYVAVRDAEGNYSFISYSCDESEGSYKVSADISLFKSTAGSNPVTLQNTPDGNNVFVMSVVDNKIWNIRRDKKGVYTLNKNPVVLPMLPRLMLAAPDNSTLYVILQQSMKSGMMVLNISDLSTSNFPFPASYATLINFQQAVVSPDGSRLFITDADTAGVRVMSTDTFRVIQTLSWQQNLQYPCGIALSPNGSSLYLTGLNSNNMAIINEI